MTTSTIQKITKMKNKRTNPHFLKRIGKKRRKNRHLLLPVFPHRRAILKKLKNTFQRLKRITYSTSSIKRKLAKSASLNKTLSRFFLNRKASNHRHRSFSAVYLDDLYSHASESPSTSAAAKTTPNKVETTAADPYNELVGTSNKIATGSSSVSTNEIVISTGTEREMEEKMDDDVDQRAEQFIAKFYEEMRLQKQRSSEEYQEILSRQTSMTHTHHSP